MNRRYRSLNKEKKLDMQYIKKYSHRPITFSQVADQKYGKKNLDLFGKKTVCNPQLDRRSTICAKKISWINIAEENRIQKCGTENTKTGIISEPKKFKLRLSQKKKICSSAQGYKLPQMTSIKQICVDSYKGLRDYNEDRILSFPCLKLRDQQVSLFGVFDGHGGSSVAEYLKNNFVKEFQNVFLQKQQAYESALKQTLIQLQRKIILNGIKLNSGSCALVCLIVEDMYYIANVGDSRALLIKQEGNFQQITKDHKPSCPNQYSRILKNGGQVYRSFFKTGQNEKIYGPFRVNPGKLSVSRTIGDYSIKKSQKNNIISSEPQTFTGKLHQGEILLFFSDGAYQKFTNSQISKYFSYSSLSKSSLSNSSSKALLSMTRQFIKECSKRDTSDNVSLVAVEINRECSQKNSLDNLTAPSL